MESYWSKKAATRRTVLRWSASAAGSVGVLSLLGCSSSGGSKKTPEASASPTAQSGVLDLANGKPGGTLTFMIASAWNTLDPPSQNSPSMTRMAALSYSGLLALRYGVAGVDVADHGVEPDLAQALPEQPDPQTFVFKLKDAKFHSGRPLTAEDVSYSLDRYANWDKSAFRAAMAWLDHVETPDSKTVVVKTKYAYADGLQAMAASGYGYVLAKEFEESADVNNRFMGTGPYTFVSHEPGISISFRKFPDYHNKPQPFFNEIKGFIGQDPAKRVADFSAHNFNLSWWYAIDDREQVKRNRPDAKFEVIQNSGDRITLRGDRAPFNDVRVRQALSQTINRKVVRDASSRGEGQGDTQFQSTDTYWGARLPQDIPGAAKFWTYDPAEAKKLLAAAGINTPIEAPWTHYDNTIIGQAFIDRITLTEANWKDLGVANIRDNVVPSTTVTTTVNVGNYEGLTAGPASLNALTGQYLVNTFYTAADGTRGINNISYYNNAQVNQLLDKQRSQFNTEERKATFRNIEQQIATDQPSIHWDTYPLSYFWDANVVNARMPVIMGSFHFARKWWFA